MVDFLLADGTCELLLEFITQIGDRPRPYPHESDSLELKYSYRYPLSFNYSLFFLVRQCCYQ